MLIHKKPIIKKTNNKKRALKKRGNGPAFYKWWVVRGSNPRPIRCKRIALPAELTTRIQLELNMCLNNKKI